ncbi:hypothetical protein [Methylophilus sp. YYY-1]|uniref:hypothetical protein n=1 Tax=Methylophilus sp. YYY-1 TaxID=2682087 RepID=UPI0023B23E29|nr:hypothetical protein [Methylophilus sp. YYY-1]MDF0376618.1 hypothetical protein [Methylophilus sp. YYY-1]
MKNHWMPPLVGEIADGKVTWLRLDSIDYESLGYFLSCHLIIEHYLDHFIATYMPTKFDWEGAKLTFGQKASLISTLEFPEPYNLPPTIKYLNSLRNKFSHDVTFILTEQELLPIRQFVEKCTEKKLGAQFNIHDLLNTYTGIVCAYFASSISHSARFQIGK